MKSACFKIGFSLLLSFTTALLAQVTPTSAVSARLAASTSPQKHSSPTAVLWLKPVLQTPATPFVSSDPHTLLQKNRTFMPHLLVIPVGSVVQFPNADPFFHNVFSLFDGKRFDLGLYEAGSTKSVTFSREGVSYIFCNIHPEMSAVVMALSTRLFSVSDESGTFRIPDVPEGDYEMHIWIEGASQPALNDLTRRVHISAASSDLGRIKLPSLDASPHNNMYGKPYDRDVEPPY